jgi:flagellar biosynthesis/type III secretory pathway protein FliH
MIVEKKIDNTFNIENYVFSNLQQGAIINGEVIDYNLKDLRENNNLRNEPDKQIIIREIEHSRAKNFNIDPLVKVHRKIKETEEENYENQIEERVIKRVDVIKENSKEEGYQKGLEIGHGEAIDKLAENINSYLDKLNLINEELSNKKKELVDYYKEDLIRLMTKTMKWVCKKELSKDDNYLEKLFDEMLNQYDINENIIVYLSPRDLMKFPQILKHYESKVDGKNKSIKNIKFEKREDLLEDEIVIESDNLLLSSTDKDIYNKIEDAYQRVISDE